MYIKNEGTVDNIRLIITDETEIIGDPTRTFTGIAPIDDAKESDLTFYTGKGMDRILKSKSRMIIVGKEVGRICNILSSTTFIVVDDPRLAFIECLNFYFPSTRKTEIHPTANISSGCLWGSNVKIGPNVVILGHVVIGSNVEICANTVIGGDGFGFQRNKDGELIKFPHFGSVYIEDNVEIGSNVCIDRGNFGATVIGKGTKIDNLVHISHNVKIGKNCLVIAQSFIGGSAVIGDSCWVAPHGCVRDRISVGNNCTIGLGAVVTHDVPDGDIVIGVPARSMKK